MGQPEYPLEADCWSLDSVAGEDFSSAGEDATLSPWLRNPESEESSLLLVLRCLGPLGLDWRLWSQVTLSDSMSSVLVVGGTLVLEKRLCWLHITLGMCT